MAALHALLLLVNELAKDPLLDAAELLVAREEEVLREEEEERLPGQGEGEERPQSPVRYSIVIPPDSGEVCYVLQYRTPCGDQRNAGQMSD